MKTDPKDKKTEDEHEDDNQPERPIYEDTKDTLDDDESEMDDEDYFEK